MIRVVADTSVAVSALLWRGLPHQLLRAAEAKRLELWTSPVLLDEVAKVLSRAKFAIRLASIHATVEEVVASYARLTQLVVPASIPAVITADPDDDAVLACAVTAQAPYVVSGDAHLLDLRRYHTIEVVSPRTLLNLLASHR